MNEWESQEIVPLVPLKEKAFNYSAETREDQNFFQKTRKNSQKLYKRKITFLLNTPKPSST